MKEEIQWVTLGSRNLWARICVAAESVQEHHPRAAISVVMIDGDEGINRSLFPGTIHLLEEVGVDPLPVMRMKYGVSELATAIRPWVHQYIFSKTGVRRIVYFDLDLWFLNSMETILKECEGHPLSFCPTTFHEYPSDGMVPDARSYRLSGLYNAGFLVLERGEECDRFLQWWKGWLENHCRFEAENGFFGDQRFLDVVPLFFQNVKIIQEVGCNAAYWNLHERKIHLGEGWRCGESPLYFFHFSGFDVSHPEKIAKTNLTRGESYSSSGIQQLAKEYRQLLIQRGELEFQKLDYFYQTFSEGTQIQTSFRYYCLHHPEILKGEDNPFTSIRIKKIHQRYRIIYKVKRLAQGLVTQGAKFLEKRLL